MIFSRSVIHLDADAFFASVEQSADARLRGKPIAVGGEKRGIIASASYEARKFGVYTPMPTVMARRLCPRLIILPGDFEKYELFSRLMFSYAYDFTPDVEIGSIDEGYLDLTGARKPALSIAETIRRAIRQSLKLSVSEGIGSNKLISQIASKLQKPAAFEFVPAGQEAQFLSPLANKWLPGIGPKTASQLNAAGLAHIGQIAQTPPDLLGLLVGSMAPQLRNFARGIDERPVIPARAPAKSYGEQETFAADTTDEPFLEATLRRMADKLMAKVREDGKSIRTFTVKVRYNDMDEDQAGESLHEPTDLETDLYSRLPLLLRKAWQRRVSLRLVSLKLSNVYEGRFSAGLGLDVSARQHDARQRLADIADQLRHKFGPRVLLRGHDFTLREEKGRDEDPSNMTVMEKFRNTLGVAQRVPPHPTPHPQGEGIPFTYPERLGASDRQVGRECPPELPKLLPLPQGEGRGEGEKNARTTMSPSLRNTPQFKKYNLAVVQRQRLGHYAARRLPEAKAPPSPGPELRFRTITNPAQSKPVQASPTQKPGATTPPRPKFSKPRALTSLPLNVHSYYSFLDSTLSINAIIDLAKHYDLPAIALTDKNNLHGAVEFAQAAAKAGIKPIIGAELEFHGQRLCLYVQNQTGYQNLCRILSVEGRESKVEGRNIEHRLFSHTDGLLALSPSPELAPFFPDRFYLEISSPKTLSRIASPHQSTNPSIHQSLPQIASFPIHYALTSDRWKYDIVQSIRTLTLLRQNHPEKRLYGEYHFRSAAETHQLFAAHPELLANTHELAGRCSFQFTLGQPQFPGYPPPDGSTPAVFLRKLVMEGLQRRYRSGDHSHCRLKAAFQRGTLPSGGSFLQLKSQVEQELAIITEVGYEEYFLVMWDILQECRRRGIEWITRGSAADSLACYCLEISGVCPIRFDLYFRRFLNKERMALNKLPDIDVDFPHDRKDDVIDLIFEKYGPEHTAVVGGFSTFQSRSAFAEIAKVLGVSEGQVRRLTEQLPHFSRAGELSQAIAETQECRDLPFEEEPYRTALQMAHFLDGFPRYPKMHPCGLVLSRQPMNEVTPCFISAKGYPTTHFDMDSIEAVGLVKMDILAQGGLAVMRDVKQMLKKCSLGGEKLSLSDKTLSECVEKSSFNNAKCLPHDKKCSPYDEKCLPPAEKLSPNDVRKPGIDLESLEPWEDAQVWELITRGDARAVHHIESPAMISLCKMCNVQDIDTLIAIVSVIRPGAANESKKMEFARRYQCSRRRQSALISDRSKSAPTDVGGYSDWFAHPSLESCLRSTFGLVVYEEHILQICEAFAGLPPGRADVLRRALGKGKSDIIEQIKSEFAACARQLGRAEDKISEVWDLVAGFKGYAFCKAHSTAYGVEAYQSAWLKRYHPVEFMAGVLTNGKGFYDPLVYILECHRLGIPLLPPSVNEPGPGFTVSSDPVKAAEHSRTPKPDGVRMKQIRVPLLNITGLAPRTKETILREYARAEFESLQDFLRRVQPLNEEMESLIKAGAFDTFGKPRTTQYWEFKQKSEVASRSDSHSPTHSLTHSSIQLPLLPPQSLSRLPSVPLAEPDHLQRLRWEEEFLGYPVSGHPLELYPNIAWDTYCPINRTGEHAGEQIVTCGLVIEQRLFHQITGEPMKFLTIADWTGMIETELFAKAYKSYGLNTVRYRVLEIAATVEPFENGRGFTLRVHRAGKPRKRAGDRTLPTAQIG